MVETSWYRWWKIKDWWINIGWKIGVSTSKTRSSKIEDGSWNLKKGGPKNLKNISSRRTSGRAVSLYPGEVCGVSCSNVVFSHECVSFGVLWLEKTTKEEPRQINCAHKVDSQGVSRDLWCSKNLHQAQRIGAYSWSTHDSQVDETREYLWISNPSKEIQKPQNSPWRPCTTEFYSRTISTA